LRRRDWTHLLAIVAIFSPLVLFLAYGATRGDGDAEAPDECLEAWNVPSNADLRAEVLSRGYPVATVAYEGYTRQTCEFVAHDDGGFASFSASVFPTVSVSCRQG
jgi:hypothetical protein